jgi:CIC family chloride channel protein
VAFAIIGMSTFFTAVVRAPFTGIVLIVEMTATTTQLMPMLAAAGTATLAATLLRGLPVYDTLRLRMLRREAAEARATAPGTGA